GIEPTLREWDGKGSLVAFILSLNLHRRHLTSSQRAAVAVEATPLLEAEAKERQREGGRKGGTSRGKVSQKVDEPSVNAGRAAEAAAKLLGTNRQYVHEAGRLKELAPDLLAQVKEGTLTISQALKEMLERERTPQELLQRSRCKYWVRMEKWRERIK